MMGTGGAIGGGVSSSSSSTSSSSSSSSSPCGACKFLRRKCERGCIFAPYFGSEHQSRFEAVHKVFGASNVSKMLQRIPVSELRRQAIISISYEAQARMSDPIYGCVSDIIALQQQVAGLQTELAFLQSQLEASSTLQHHQQQHEVRPTSPTLSGYYGCSSTLTNSSPNPFAHYSSFSSSSCCNNNVSRATSSYNNVVGRMKDEHDPIISTTNYDPELFSTSYNNGLLSSASTLSPSITNNNRDNMMIHDHGHIHDHIMNEHDLQAIANVISLH